MNRILITGGLGFIGIHSIEKWLQNDYEIYVIDNKSSNAVDESHDLVKQTNLIVKNILEVEWNSLPKFDKILHLASQLVQLES